MNGVHRYLVAGSLIAGSLTAGAGTAAADDGFSIELFEPGEGRAILGVGTSEAFAQGDFMVGLFTHYEDDPITLVDVDDRGRVLERLVDGRITTEVLAAVGLVDWLEIGLAMPLVLTQSGEDLGPLGRAGETVDGFALGDLRITPKATFLKADEGLGVQLSVALMVPTGDPDGYASDGAVRVRPMIGVDFASGGFRVAAELGYELRTERTAGTYVSDDMLRWGLAGRVPFVKDVLALLVSVQGSVQTADGIDPNNPTQSLEDSPNVGVEALGAAELIVAEGLRFTLGGGTALVHAVGSPDVRGFLGIAWVAPTRAVTDDDGDGFFGSDDECPNQPEDKDGFHDHDGCPDLDDDGDGVADLVDRCRLEPEDKDGVDDADGCPDTDDDGDGVTADKCPTEKEDKDGFQDDDGCPDPDNDGDGILDAADKCPDQAEVKNGFQDEDGCPEFDSDNDNVPDELDKCPDRPEVKNGIDDTDGCPDSAEKDLVLAGDEIQVKGKVKFVGKSDKLVPESLPLLDALARLMKDHAYITKLRIEAHSDSEGSDEQNIAETTKQATAIVDYLVQKGVAAGRLEAVGYGEGRPIATNVTPGGRAKNKRVEIRVREIDGKALPEPPPPKVK